MSENQSPPKWYNSLLSSLGDWFKLNGGTFLANMIMQYGGTYIKSAIGGIPGTLALVIFKWIVIPFLNRFKKELVIDAEAKKKLQDFVNVIHKEGVTHEEFSQAGDDFFNRP